MARPQGTGRKKIDITKIENKLHLKTTFTKRRQGLFKKVADFCATSRTKTAVFTFSPYGRPYSFADPSEIEVIEAFYSAQRSINNDNASSAIDEHEAREFCEEEEEDGNDGFWWAADVDISEIDEFKEFLSEFKNNLIRQIEELQRRNGALLNLFV